jgi:hypothetical protein
LCCLRGVVRRGANAVRKIRRVSIARYSACLIELVGIVTSYVVCESCAIEWSCSLCVRSPCNFFRLSMRTDSQSASTSTTNPGASGFAQEGGNPSAQFLNV